VTLAEVQSVSPARAVSDEEMLAALETVYGKSQRALSRGDLNSVWHNELRRLTGTYCGYVASLSIAALKAGLA
jgi:hypothetical protein